jgi:hypothetical protein
MDELPMAYQIGDPGVLNRSSIWWAHRYVQNVAQLKYSMMKQDIRTLQVSTRGEGGIVRVMSFFSLFSSSDGGLVLCLHVVLLS